MSERTFDRHESLALSALQLMSLVTFIYALAVTLVYSAQPLFEQYSFRQTQTALTAFWLIKDGFKLAYETPVAGAPWSIPFEAPIYQGIVAAIVKIFGTPLDQTGRIVSFAFLTLCLLPARSICKKLKLNSATFYLFSCLLFSSPIYLEWGRSFMIETCALFFSIQAISFFLDILESPRTRSIALFVILISLAILQKATTGLPVLAVLAFVILFKELKEHRYTFKVINGRNLWLAAVLFALPLAIGYGWTRFTDVVKTQNELGAALTSSALSTWNWGTLPQRLLPKLYEEVIWQRIFEKNLGSFVGLLAIVTGLFAATTSRSRIAITTALIMGLAPLFIFTNLHLIHTYYQSANIIFLIFAVAFAIAAIADRQRSTVVALVVAVAILGSNYLVFSRNDLQGIRQTFTAENSRELGVALAIKANTTPEEGFVAFGNDWSSSLGYYAERKSFTVPNWYKGFNQVATDSSNVLGGLKVGAVATCPAAPRPTEQEMMNLNIAGAAYAVSRVQGCLLAVPESHPVGNPPANETQCEGSLDFATLGDTPTRTLSVEGWTTISGHEGKVPDNVYLSLTGQDGTVQYYGTLHTARPDVNKYLKQPELPYPGFSRLINTSSLSGHYQLGVVREYNHTLEKCQFTRPIEIK